MKTATRLMALMIVAIIGLMTPIKAQAAPPPAAVPVNFDAQRYANTYADLKEAFGDDEAALWQHYLDFGIYEGRTAFIKGVGPGLTQVNFDAKRYANTYPDIKQAFGDDEAALWQHYLDFGIYEGRHVFAKGATTVVIAEEPAQAKESIKGIVGPEPPLPPTVGPEPPIEEYAEWNFSEVVTRYPNSPGPWARDDYDPDQDYIAIPPNSDDRVELIYPEFLTPEEVKQRFGVDPTTLPDDYFERKIVLYGNPPTVGPEPPEKPIVGPEPPLPPTTP